MFPVSYGCHRSIVRNRYYTVAIIIESVNSNNSDIQPPRASSKSNISSLARSILTEKNSLDSSLNELSTDALAVQIGSAEPLLASFSFALSFYEESLDGRGYVTVLSTDALQAPLDRARGELPSDTQTLIFH